LEMCMLTSSRRDVSVVDWGWGGLFPGQELWAAVRFLIIPLKLLIPNAEILQWDWWSLEWWRP
jgi:hypothetical protein